MPSEIKPGAKIMGEDRDRARKARAKLPRHTDSVTCMQALHPCPRCYDEIQSLAQAFADARGTQAICGCGDSFGGAAGAEPGKCANCWTFDEMDAERKARAARDKEIAAWLFNVAGGCPDEAEAARLEQLAEEIAAKAGGPL